MKLKIALALFSTLSAIYAVELGLAFFDQPPERSEVARSQGITFDTRSQREVVRDLHSAGHQAFPLVPPEQFLPGGIPSRDGNPLLPLAGISRVTTVWCNEGGQYFIFPSDPHGFNNPPDAWSVNPEILLVGDSFTQGACAEAGADLGNQLRGQGHDVLNLGIGGSGPLMTLGVLREYAETQQPKITFWLYYEGNDLLNLRNEMSSPILRRYLEEANFSQGLRQRQEELDALLKVHLEPWFEQRAEHGGEWTWPARATSWSKLTHLRSRLSLLDTRIPTAVFDLLARVLQQARERLAHQDSELVFVYLPAYSRYASPGVDHHRDRVLSVVRALRIPLVDFHQVIAHSDKPERFFPLGVGGHYNSYGYRLLAEELRRFVSTSS